MASVVFHSSSAELSDPPADVSSCKKQRYIQLVNSRRSCQLCQSLGVRNPSTCSKDEFGSKNIGPWTNWQGNLDAELMIVGQEWDGYLNYIDQEGKDQDTSPTNTRLKELLSSIGVNICLPSQSRDRAVNSQGSLFFTNAALCLRDGRASENNNQSKTPPVRCFRNCATSFLFPQIELVRPRLVITLGLIPYRSVLYAYGIKPKRSLSEAVSSAASIPLNERTALIPVYHPGAWSRRRNRTLDQQVEDWKRISTPQNLRASGVTCLSWFWTQLRS